MLEDIPATSSRYSSIASSSDGTKLAAVELGGYIYTSSDSGATWTQATSACSRNWGGYYSGYIYTSTISGAWLHLHEYRQWRLVDPADY